MKSRKILAFLTIGTILVSSTGCGDIGMDNSSSYEANKIVTTTTTSIPKSIQTATETTVAEEPTTTTTTTVTTTTTTQATTTAQTTAKTTTTEATTTVTATPPITSSEYSYLPESVMQVVEKVKKQYPDMDIGVGLYSLDGSKGYVYQDLLAINSASTIKATFGKFVLTECERRGIDLSTTYLTYYPKHYSNGSGVISKTGKYGDRFTIEYLIEVMYSESDNAAYSMLLDMFPLNQFYEYNKKIGGENDGLKYGKATVNQRKNEWLAMYEYITSNSKYSNKLREVMTGTKFAYIPEGMVNTHSYMHKSGWMTRSFTYPAAGDCAIIDDSYLLIIMTQDWLYGLPRIDAIQEVARAVEEFYDKNGGNIF